MDNHLLNMDDNENLIDFQKMNFSPFTTQFSGFQPTASLHQFTAAKFAQNITTANGQVVGVVSGGDGGVQFLRQLDGSLPFQNQLSGGNPPTSLANMHQAQTFILPITMPGDKPGDAQQTVQIQVLNPNPMQQQPKYQMAPMQIPLQGFQQPTVLTVAVPHDNDVSTTNHGVPEGLTVLAAIQPQDLQVFGAQTGQSMPTMAGSTTGQSQSTMQSVGTQSTDDISKDDDIVLKPEFTSVNGEESIVIKQEPDTWDTGTVQQPQPAPPPELSEYLNWQGLSMNLQQFLKFNTDTIKKEMPPIVPISGLTSVVPPPITTEIIGPVKKKRKYKKKPPKPKPPKPGQVHIATALDGTILFCCPECQMAYPEKSNLEQHLTVHKIERRYICDLCGAGLKRKEHLERHKMGHSPERPYICSVCMKGFKRKEHLNLHFVIHSGVKSEICFICGKGFYRKDHLRKHAKSHETKRIKEEMQAAVLKTYNQQQDPAPDGSDSVLILNSSNFKMEPISEPLPNDTIRLPAGVTIHVPTSNNTTLPVQIQLPQLVTTNGPDGTTNTVVLRSTNTNGTLQDTQ